ncbi:MAG: succinate--CoA ligase subunit beta, partial [Caldiserica bacterium]|nr:succinate--CoA ligase subunit beta [Caldisericota bacterium]
MRLLEWQGRVLFRKFDIPVPRGVVVDDAHGASRAAEEIGAPVVLKAQIPVGGRGKAGGIRLARTPAEAEA